MGCTSKRPWPYGIPTVRSREALPRLDPTGRRGFTGAWEMKVTMKTGRSEMEVAVIGDLIFIIGGWNERGVAVEEKLK